MAAGLSSSQQQQAMMAAHLRSDDGSRARGWQLASAWMMAAGLMAAVS